MYLRRHVHAMHAASTGVTGTWRSRRSTPWRVTPITTRRHASPSAVSLHSTRLWPASSHPSSLTTICQTPQPGVCTRRLRPSTSAIGRLASSFTRRSGSALLAFGWRSHRRLTSSHWTYSCSGLDVPFERAVFWSVSPHYFLQGLKLSTFAMGLHS